jgi:hypothetical protein
VLRIRPIGVAHAVLVPLTVEEWVIGKWADPRPGGRVAQKGTRIWERSGGFLGSEDPRYLIARTMLSNRLQTALTGLEEHWKKIGAWKARHPDCTRAQPAPANARQRRDRTTELRGKQMALS